LGIVVVLGRQVDGVGEAAGSTTMQQHDDGWWCGWAEAVSGSARVCVAGWQW
jgi:hypothetical protein